jgi:hypothetical protein
MADAPLYPSEAEIGKLILGPARAKEWPAIAATLEKRGLPPVDPLTGGRYLPAVRAFLDRRHGVDAVAPAVDPTEGEDWSWKSDPRASKRRA